MTILQRKYFHRVIIDKTHFLFLKMILNPKHIKITVSRAVVGMPVVISYLKSVDTYFVIGVPSGGIPS